MQRNVFFVYFWFIFVYHFQMFHNFCFFLSFPHRILSCILWYINVYIHSSLAFFYLVLQMFSCFSEIVCMLIVIHFRTVIRETCNQVISFQSRKHQKSRKCMANIFSCLMFHFTNCTLTKHTQEHENELEYSKWFSIWSFHWGCTQNNVCH